MKNSLLDPVKKLRLSVMYRTLVQLIFHNAKKQQACPTIGFGSPNFFRDYAPVITYDDHSTP
jgi:hypothetical protein